MAKMTKKGSAKLMTVVKRVATVAAGYAGANIASRQIGTRIPDNAHGPIFLAAGAAGAVLVKNEVVQDLSTGMGTFGLVKTLQSTLNLGAKLGLGDVDPAMLDEYGNPIPVGNIDWNEAAAAAEQRVLEAQEQRALNGPEVLDTAFQTLTQEISGPQSVGAALDERLAGVPEGETEA